MKVEDIKKLKGKLRADFCWDGEIYDVCFNDDNTPIFINRKSGEAVDDIECYIGMCSLLIESLKEI